MVTRKDTVRDWLLGKVQARMVTRKDTFRDRLPGKIKSGTGYQERYSQGLVT